MSTDGQAADPMRRREGAICRKKEDAAALFLGVQ